MQRAVKVQVGAAGGSRVIQVFGYGMFNVSRQHFAVKKRLHHFFEIALPLRAVRFCLVFMFVPGMQVCKLVHGSYQECVRIQIKVYRDAVPLALMRRAVVAEFAVAVARNFKLTFKVVDPPTDQRGCFDREILFKNFYLIQFLPHSKDRELSRKAKYPILGVAYIFGFVILNFNI